MAFCYNQVKKLKEKIRIAAEKEEKAFYNHRATKEWKKDLESFNVTWEKPFLRDASCNRCIQKDI